MSTIQTQKMVEQHDAVSFRDLMRKSWEWVIYLKTKWIIILIACVFGVVLGYLYAKQQKPIYIGTLSFVLEDEKSDAGFSGAMGLASSLGFDINGGGGGIFSGANLIELMKSRTIVEKALLHPISVDGKRMSLADYFIKIFELDKGWDKNTVIRNIKFDPMADRSGFTFYQDSILGKLYGTIIGSEGILSVVQKDKKTSILHIEVRTTNELFSKAFTESIAEEVSEFYIETKSKKARINYSILQKQTDSVRRELNGAIVGVAVANDNTFNLNPGLNINRTPSARRQIDVQANTVILTQLVSNLEMAKVALRKETPLIQVIDRPILPLKKEGLSIFRCVIISCLSLVSLVIVCLMGVRFVRNQLRN